MSTTYVLDAWALLAFLNAEPGGNIIKRQQEQDVITT
jgi:hypothetical protein